MKSQKSRRDFLTQMGYAGAGIAASSVFALPSYSQAKGRTARATLGLVAPRADFDRRLFGAFLEHLGRAVYTGVYEPGSPLADKRGFRTDTLREVKDLNVPIMRYPGGNMVSGYNWWDGVGPKKNRPTVLERAWNQLETNQFGTNDFMDWAKAVGTEPLLGFNLGTGTSEMAVAYIEYCNYAKGTKWSEMRRSHGYDAPHKVKYWCLGNEMDGPWQMGRLQAREYGRKARDIAQQARVIDPDVKLIACGSSNTILPTYLTWDREVLEECYDQVDGISLHNYWGNETELTGGKSERFLANNLDMERQIHEIIAVADYVQGLYRSPKKLWLSFDEWNVWYRARSQEHLDGKGAYAPKLLEEVYNLEDAMLTGGFLNTLMRQSERVHLACLAQIVNVIAPLVTNEKGILRQPTFYPYQFALKYAQGRMLDIQVDCETYPIKAVGLRADFARDEEVPFIDAVASYDAKSGRVAVFVLNRDLSNERELALTFEDIAPRSVVAAETITGPDVKAFNTFAEPNKVVATKLDGITAGGKMTIKLPPRSYSVIQLAV
ncbi:MAG: alpha-N-arabinofuranosidase [Steroidobacteraceae bacterium]|nr:alpha-N-arabinofuranosidase [Steroidobacteraceae bacterium]